MPRFAPKVDPVGLAATDGSGRVFQFIPLLRRGLTRPPAATQEGYPIRDSEFPKGNDSGIRNLESGIRNPQMQQAKWPTEETLMTRPSAA